MKSKVRKDKNNRKLMSKVEIKSLILKSLKKNYNLTKLTNWNSGVNLTKPTFNYVTTKLVNRCVITGRKSIYTKILNISRLKFLQLARNGDLVGLKKASW